MPQGQKTVIFDTSAINRLADDAEGRIITKGTVAGYRVRITATSIAEAAADPGARHRRQLFEVVKLLLSNGECILPFQWIINLLANEYAKQAQKSKWNSMDVRFLKAEQALHDNVFLDDAASKKIRQEDKVWGDEFEQIYRNERPAFDDIFAGYEKLECDTPAWPTCDTYIWPTW
jgi:hypothetical protein